MKSCDLSRQSSMDQSGFTLAGLLVTLTLLAVILAFTVPTKWSDVRNRERDRQLIFVMEQYARGIREFQLKTGAMPTSLEQLGEFNNPRVMRQLYPNPLSGELDWILVPPGAATGAGADGRTRPNPQVAAPQEPVPQPGTGAGDGEYVGPFIGVRPPQTGESILELKGATRYEEWSYTVTDLQQEQNPQQGQPGQPGQPGQNPNPQPGN